MAVKDASSSEGKKGDWEREFESGLEENIWTWREEVTEKIA
jgi:hypothetical protein